MITDVILIVGGVLLLLNLLAPLFVWRSQTIPARVRLEAVSEPGFVAARCARFRELDARLLAMGGEYIGSSTLTVGTATTHFSVYLLDGGLTFGTLVSITGAAEEVVYTDFSRLYEDGSILDVNNAPVVSAYPDMKIKIMARLPKIQEPAALHAAFLQLAGTLQNSAAPANARDLDCFSAIRDFIERESDELVRRGYCHADIDVSGSRSLTLKGAYLMTWGQLAPGNWIRKALDARYARRLLQAT